MKTIVIELEMILITPHGILVVKVVKLLIQTHGNVLIIVIAITLTPMVLLMIYTLSHILLIMILKTILNCVTRHAPQERVDHMIVMIISFVTHVQQQMKMVIVKNVQKILMIII